jgi:hypothetical protein
MALLNRLVQKPVLIYPAVASWDEIPSAVVRIQKGQFIFHDLLLIETELNGSVHVIEFDEEDEPHNQGVMLRLSGEDVAYVSKIDGPTERSRIALEAWERVPEEERQRIVEYVDLLAAEMRQERQSSTS